MWDPTLISIYQVTFFFPATCKKQAKGLGHPTLVVSCDEQALPIFD
jgi:hypothetical protein